MPPGEQRGTPGAGYLQKAGLWGSLYDSSRCPRAMLPQAREQEQQRRDAPSHPASPLDLHMGTNLVHMQTFAKKPNNNKNTLQKKVTYDRETSLSSVGLYEICTAPFLTGNLGLPILPLGLLPKQPELEHLRPTRQSRFGVWPPCLGTVSPAAKLSRGFSVRTADFSFPSGNTKSVRSGGSRKTGQRCRQLFCAAPAKPHVADQPRGDGFTGRMGRGRVSQ